MNARSERASAASVLAANFQSRGTGAGCSKLQDQTNDGNLHVLCRSVRFALGLSPESRGRRHYDGYSRSSRSASVESFPPAGGGRAGVTWILDGLEVTIIGAIAPVLQDTQTLGLSAGEIGAAGSAYVIGAVVGALLFGWLTDRFGRRLVFYVTLIAPRR